jgi:hypothetical protein
VSTVVKDHLFVKCLSVLAKMWACPTTDPFLGRRLTPNSLNYHRGYHWPLLSKVTVRRFPSKRLKRSRACPPAHFRLSFLTVLIKPQAR